MVESSNRHSSDGSWGKRKSLFALSALKPSTSITSSEEGGDGPFRSAAPKGKGKHARGRGSLNDLDRARPSSPLARPSDSLHLQTLAQQPAQRPARPSLNMKNVRARPPSMFGSLKHSIRVNTDELSNDAPSEPASATSAHTASSFHGDHGIDPLAAHPRTVLMHGEVQTSAGMFRKKKEYLVLTEIALIRYKSQSRAADAFRSIPHSRAPMTKHGSVASIGSYSDLQTLSDSSGDKDGKILLRQIVAIHKLDDGKPYFALEICFLDEEVGLASAMALQFNLSEERDAWLRRLRDAADAARMLSQTDISPANLESLARSIERDKDYDPSNCSIFKVVQRQPSSRSASRNSSDDLAKVASVVCFLAIGVHKVHLIQIPKPLSRTSSLSLASSESQSSYGILTLTNIKVSSVDDEFELSFRQPLQRTRTLYLASAAAYDIAARLHAAEIYLRPECSYRLYRMSVPPEVEEILVPRPASDGPDHSHLDRTLSAYCIAYGVDPANVRYTINYACEDAPRFELLTPADTRRTQYTPLELLAILRALRYNETFGGISLAGIQLDGLNGLHDHYGHEMVCTRTKRGTLIRLAGDQLAHASMLVQEVRALAACSKKLRFMDFSGCITRPHNTPASSPDDDPRRGAKDIGCGIVEALSPLCKHQTTNVDWVCLNGIELSETDLDYLVGAAVDKSCHFRAIELNRCGLGDRSMGLILDALRYQENTLESLEIAGNTARFHPAAFDLQLGVFGFVRKLNLSHVSITSGTEPLLQAETLLTWRLQELRFSGTTLNDATVEAISLYLAHPQSSGLRQLCVDNTYIDGRDVATLLHSLSAGDADQPRPPRELHLDISQSLLNKNGELVAQAIAASRTPAHLSMRAIEYRDEALFRKILVAFAQNTSTRTLDLSQAGLPGDAGEETCRALERLLAQNTTLLDLDLSGEESRLAASKFGPGILSALAGLATNSTLQIFRIEKQKLGLPGGIALAEVLRTNCGLMEVHCDGNAIPLQGFTGLVNALEGNGDSRVVYLPEMWDGRDRMLGEVEREMRGLAESSPSGLSSSASGGFGKSTGKGPTSLFGAEAVRKGIHSVKKSAQRTSLATRGASSAHADGPRVVSAARSHMTGTSHLPASQAARLRDSPVSLAAVPPPQTKRKKSISGLHIASLATTTSSTTDDFVAAAPCSVHDVHAAQRLLTEQWNLQCVRLAACLERNWCRLHGVPWESDSAASASGGEEGLQFTDPPSSSSVVSLTSAPTATPDEKVSTPRTLLIDPVAALTPRDLSDLLNSSASSVEYFDSPIDAGASISTPVRTGSIGAAKSCAVEEIVSLPTARHDDAGAVQDYSSNVTMRPRTASSATAAMRLSFKQFLLGNE